MPNSEPTTSRQAPGLRWLAIGAAGGLVAAAFGLLERSPGVAELPVGAVARVNETLISEAQFERAVEQVASAYGRELTADDRERILTQLVEEELLVQRGVDLGMTQSENTVRSAIVQSLIASITAEADAADPSDDELERFLKENAERYTYASALDVDAWIAEDEWVAQDFVNRLRNGATSPADDRLRDIPGLPSGPVPLERLRMFLGPAITAAAADMPEAASAVYARQGRWYVVRVNRHEESTLAELDAVRSQVMIDYRRSLADAKVRTYLDDLERAADVVVAPAP